MDANKPTTKDLLREAVIEATDPDDALGEIYEYVAAGEGRLASRIFGERLDEAWQAGTAVLERTVRAADLDRLEPFTMAVMMTFLRIAAEEVAWDDELAARVRAALIDKHGVAEEAAKRIASIS